MSDGDGVRQGETAEKSLGEIVGDVSQKATMLVREEIALAKAEITQKLGRLTRGAIFFAGALAMVIYFSIFFFLFLALGLNDWFNLKPWVGFAIVALAFLIVTGVLALLGVRAVRRGTPPTPQLAIEEARKTRAAIEEVRR